MTAGTVAGLLSPLLPGVFIARSSSAADEAELLVQVDFLITNSQIGDIVAIERGFYRDQGFKLTLMPGGPNAQTVPSVLSGRAQTGIFSGLGQALTAVGNGLPVEVFACGYQTSPFAFVSLPRSPIRKPQDMVGKKIAIQPTGRFVMDLIFMKNRIDPASVTVISAGSDVTPLMTGQIDCITMFTTNANALAALGPDYITMTQTDAGVVSYANAYFAPKAFVAEKKDLLKRYLAATAKGWGWTHDHPDEAADILAKAYPNLDARQEKATVGKVLGLAFDAETRAKGWGTVSAERVAEMIGLYKQAGRFTRSPPEVADIVSLDILKATEADRPKYG